MTLELPPQDVDKMLETKVKEANKILQEPIETVWMLTDDADRVHALYKQRPSRLTIHKDFPDLTVNDINYLLNLYSTTFEPIICDHRMQLLEVPFGRIFYTPH